jgi:2-polyprenyl-3-methyl-5-hydroxy-6-metoxy-1,4-benzoquinol methylase
VPAFLEFCEPLAGRVLDVGCGTNILSAMLLAQPGVTGVVGIDITDPLLAQARTSIADTRARLARGLHERASL